MLFRRAGDGGVNGV